MSTDVPGGDAPVAGAERALLADLLGTYDVLELLDRLLHVAVRSCDAGSAAILVPHPAGLQVLAATSETARDLELFQAMTGEGPAFDCLRGGLVVAPDLDEEKDRWPRFAPAAEARGIGGVVSLRMQVRGTVVGAFNVFDPARHGEDDLAVLQSFADLAVLAVVQPVDTEREDAYLVARLRRTLDRRVLVEQAKGVVAETLQMTPTEAGPVLLAHARGTGRLLREVADDVVHLRLDPREIVSQRV